VVSLVLTLVKTSLNAVPVFSTAANDSERNACSDKAIFDSRSAAFVCQEPLEGMPASLWLSELRVTIGCNNLYLLVEGLRRLESGPLI
jgi:hypothetical protein